MLTVDQRPRQFVARNFQLARIFRKVAGYLMQQMQSTYLLRDTVFKKQ